MPTIEYSGLKINLDDEGYLVNGDDWNEKVACALAEREGIEELTKERMEILSFLRDYYRRFNYFLSWMQCVLTSTTQPVRQGKIHASAKGLEDSRAAEAGRCRPCLPELRTSACLIHCLNKKPPGAHRMRAREAINIKPEALNRNFYIYR